MPSSKENKRTSASRDRDALGRPLNARPRDRLGRPLAREETGVPSMPEGMWLPPEESLAQAQQLLDEGRPFHAHEVLESSWKSAPESERELWQALAQLAVGLTHMLRGNSTGAVAVLSRSRERLTNHIGVAPYGIDVPGLIAWCDQLLGRLELSADHDGQDVSAPQLRR